MVAVLALFAVDASAQLGVKLDYVNSSQRFKLRGVVFKPGTTNGVNVGVVYDIGLPVTGLSIRPGLTYTYLGGNFNIDIMDIGIPSDLLKQREHFLNVPIDVKYAYSINNDFSVYAFAGPKIAFGLASALTASVDGQDISVSAYTGKIKVNGETVDLSGIGGDSGDEDDDLDEGMYSRFDLQLGLGAGVQWKSLFLELGYDWGLINRSKGDTEGVTMKRGQFHVGVGYRF